MACVGFYTITTLPKNIPGIVDYFVSVSVLWCRLGLCLKISSIKVLLLVSFRFSRIELSLIGRFVKRLPRYSAVYSFDTIIPL